MPAALERKLKKEANKKGIKDKDAYVYGTLRKTGWKPNREKKMSDVSKVVRLQRIESGLDKIIKFEKDDKDYLGSAIKSGALVGAGVGGTLGHQAIMRSGGYGANWAGAKSAFGLERAGLGAAPSAASSLGYKAGSFAGKGISALSKIKGILPKLKFWSEKPGREIRLDEHLLEPWGNQPMSKINQEQFPAGLSPAAALRMPFPALMRLLKQRNILQEQFPGFSRLGRLIQLNAKMDEICFADDDQYKPRIGQRLFLGPAATSFIHGQPGARPEAYGEASARHSAEVFKGTVAGGGLGATIGAGIGIGTKARLLKGIGKGSVRGVLGKRAGWGAAIGAAGGALAGADLGGLRGTFGKKATEIYKRRTGQENY